MTSQALIFLYFISLISSTPLLLLAQEPYAGIATIKCDNNTDATTSVVGYLCNGQNQSCQAYLIFRSKPPYDSVTSISKLFTSDPYKLAQINSVLEVATFQTNKEVIVPVNCSCYGHYYQANTSYVVVHQDTRYLIATDIYEGLVSCLAVRIQSNYSKFLYTGMNISIPLRCACPTTNQSRHGVKYLLTYLVRSEDSVSSISRRFGADVLTTLDANKLSEESKITESSTLLIPLQKPPSSSQTITPQTPSSSLPLNKSSKKIWVEIIIGAAVGSSVLIIFIGLFCLLSRKGKKVDQTVTCVESCKKSALPQELLAGISSLDNTMKVYGFKELRLATEKFNSKCRIEGSVYRGVIGGDAVAIKKMNGDVSKEFDLLKKINHFNIIRLLGVCFNKGQWYFVYEYAENGPLSNWIFKRNGVKVLNWMQRVEIAFDVANGLDYLHNYIIPAHVHKDINSSNILLTENLRAKIWNFGLTRSHEGLEHGFVLTRNIIGTQGYMAPEYIHKGMVSSKLDVYSFGVVLLEIITGKEAVLSQEGGMQLSEALMAFLDEGSECEKLSKFMDPSLQGDCPLNLFMVMARLVRACLRKDAASRPTISEITRSLMRMSKYSSFCEISSDRMENLDTARRDIEVNDASTSYSLSMLSYTGALWRKDGSSSNRNEKVTDDQANAPGIIFQEHKDLAQFDRNSSPIDSIDSSSVLSSLQAMPLIAETPPKITIYKGEPAICFDESITSANDEDFRYCLIGAFAASRPKLAEIRAWAIQEWKLEGDWSISLVNHGHVFIRFNRESDVLSILMKDNWVINGQEMKVMEWTPDYRPTGRESTSAIVWIALPFLPPIFFHERCLSSIASLVGRVVMIDDQKRTLPEIYVARICVEVDLQKEVPSRVWIGVGESGFWQDILYENLPSHCRRCGHSAKICSDSSL